MWGVGPGETLASSVPGAPAGTGRLMDTACTECQPRAGQCLGVLELFKTFLFLKWKFEEI